MESTSESIEARYERKDSKKSRESGDVLSGSSGVAVSPRKLRALIIVRGVRWLARDRAWSRHYLPILPILSLYIHPDIPSIVVQILAVEPLIAFVGFQGLMMRLDVQSRRAFPAASIRR